MGARGWGRQSRKLVFHGDQVSVWEDGEVLETGADDGCTVCHRNAHLKMVKLVSFMLCMFLNYFK